MDILLHTQKSQRYSKTNNQGCYCGQNRTVLSTTTERRRTVFLSRRFIQRGTPKFSLECLCPVELAFHMPDATVPHWSSTRSDHGISLRNYAFRTPVSLRRSVSISPRIF